MIYFWFTRYRPPSTLELAHHCLLLHLAHWNSARSTCPFCGEVKHWHACIARKNESVPASSLSTFLHCYGIHMVVSSYYTGCRRYYAHKQWLIPSTDVITGNEPWTKHQNRNWFEWVLIIIYRMLTWILEHRNCWNRLGLTLSPTASQVFTSRSGRCRFYFI